MFHKEIIKIIANVIPIIIVIITDVILPKFHFYKLPNIPSYLVVFYLSCNFYILTRYRFLSFSLSDITKEIITNVQDIVIILKSDKTLMEANSNYEKVLSKNVKDIAGSNFYELMESNDVILKNLKS